jgi:hypothetical protein
VDNLSTLIYLTTPNAYVSTIYRNASKELHKALAECAYNILYGEIEFTEEERTNLRRLSDQLLKLSEGKRIPPHHLPEILSPLLKYVCDDTSNQDV